MTFAFRARTTRRRRLVASSPRRRRARRDRRGFEKTPPRGPPWFARRHTPRYSTSRVSTSRAARPRSPRWTARARRSGFSEAPSPTDVNPAGRGSFASSRTRSPRGSRENLSSRDTTPRKCGPSVSPARRGSRARNDSPWRRTGPNATRRRTDRRTDRRRLRRRLRRTRRRWRRGWTRAASAAPRGARRRARRGVVSRARVGARRDSRGGG